MGCRKEKVSLTLDGNLVYELKQHAHNNDRSFSQYVNHILKEYMEHLTAAEIKYPKTNHAPDWSPKR